MNFKVSSVMCVPRSRDTGRERHICIELGERVSVYFPLREWKRLLGCISRKKRLIAMCIAEKITNCTLFYTCREDIPTLVAAMTDPDLLQTIRVKIDEEILKRGL